jgi:hypothetical protein
MCLAFFTLLRLFKALYFINRTVRFAQWIAWYFAWTIAYQSTYLLLIL